MRDEIITVKKPGLISLEAEITLCRPPGDGPHPLVCEGYRTFPAAAPLQRLCSRQAAPGQGVGTTARLCAPRSSAATRASMTRRASCTRLTTPRRG
jgi:hypothetical protein